MIDETMYVVYLTPEAVEEHKKIVESVSNSLIKEIPAVAALAPKTIIPTTITALKSLQPPSSQSLEGIKLMSEWDNHHIENTFGLQVLSEIHKKTPVTSIPSVLIFANGNAPGGARFGRGQEESFLAGTNLSYGMRNIYPQNDIWKGFGGVYAVLCQTLEQKPFWAIVMAAPNLGDVPMDFKIGNEAVTTPSDEKLFNFDPRTMKNIPNVPYLRHLLGEVLIQFCLVKSLNSPIFMTGLFGSGRFSGDPEHYSAAVRFVSELSQFKDMKVCYAVGPHNNTLYSERDVNLPFSAPKEKLLQLTKELYEKYFQTLMSQDAIQSLLAVSKATQHFYCTELPQAKKGNNAAFWNQQQSPVGAQSSADSSSNNVSEQTASGCCVM